MLPTMNSKERTHRRELAGQARAMIIQTLPIENSDESSLMLNYSGFYLQIAFSELHPLIAIYLARTLNRTITFKDIRLINEINLKSALGSHAVNTESGCYSYRAVHWLDTELSKPRFVEMLARGGDEANRAYARLTRRLEGTA